MSVIVISTASLIIIASIIINHLLLYRCEDPPGTGAVGSLRLVLQFKSCLESIVGELIHSSLCESLRRGRAPSDTPEASSVGTV